MARRALGFSCRFMEFLDILYEMTALRHFLVANMDYEGKQSFLHALAHETLGSCSGMITRLSPSISFPIPPTISHPQSNIVFSILFQAHVHERLSFPRFPQEHLWRYSNHGFSIRQSR